MYADVEAGGQSHQVLFITFHLFLETVSELRGRDFG